MPLPRQPAARRSLTLLAPLCLWVAAAFPGLARAQAPGTTVYGVEVKIIEANRSAAPTGGVKREAGLDPALAPLGKDLRALPFDEFKLLDTMRKDLERGESFTLQVGRPVRKRFLRVTAEPQQQPGKLKVAVNLEQARGKAVRTEFHTDVSIPEGGTLVVAVTRKGLPAENMLLLAISADKPRALAGGADASIASSSAPPLPAR